jgi:DNA-directed RNA polymerase sigma subunit (sigma70/sigma32)
MTNETTQYTMQDLIDADQDYQNAQLAADEKALARQAVARGLIRQGHTQEELGQRIGLTRGRIGQIVGNTRELRAEARARREAVTA